MNKSNKNNKSTIVEMVGLKHKGGYGFHAIKKTNNLQVSHARKAFCKPEVFSKLIESHLENDKVALLYCDENLYTELKELESFQKKIFCAPVQQEQMPYIYKLKSLIRADQQKVVNNAKEQDR